jgi:hypothetical protein
MQFDSEQDWAILLIVLPIIQINTEFKIVSILASSLDMFAPSGFLVALSGIIAFLISFSGRSQVEIASGCRITPLPVDSIHRKFDKLVGVICENFIFVRCDLTDYNLRRVMRNDFSGGVAHSKPFLVDVSVFSLALECILHLLHLNGIQLVEMRLTGHVIGVGVLSNTQSLLLILILVSFAVVFNLFHDIRFEPVCVSCTSIVGRWHVIQELCN